MAPRPLYGAELVAAIRAEAIAAGLDPDGVLAVAEFGEGGFSGSVGDSGTSFGPFQLHAGGELPPWVWMRGPDYARAWANSREGIRYAVQRMAPAARGKHGYAEASAIVTGFEHPRDPTAELVRIRAGMSRARGGAPAGGATRTRPGGSGGGALGDLGGALGGLFSGASGALGDVLGLISGPADFFKFLIALLDPHNWLRALELLMGLGLVFVALGGYLYLFGQRDEAPAPVRRVTRRAVRVASSSSRAAA